VRRNGVCVTSAASCNRLRHVSMRQVVVEEELSRAQCQFTLSRLPGSTAIPDEESDCTRHLDTIFSRSRSARLLAHPEI
jgi:hypothetical protein